MRAKSIGTHYAFDEYDEAERKLCLSCPKPSCRYSKDDGCDRIKELKKRFKELRKVGKKRQARSAAVAVD